MTKLESYYQLQNNIVLRGTSAAETNEAFEKMMTSI